MAQTTMRAIGEDRTVIERKAVGDGFAERVGGGHGRDGRVG